MIDPVTASHEARHASAALLLDLDIVNASAVPVQGHSAGRVLVRVEPERLREHALMVAVGAIGEDADWPPDAVPGADSTPDGRQLGALAKELGLDRSGWRRLVIDALNLSAEPRFERLEAALTHLLERGYEPDGDVLRRVKTISERAGMEHINLKAATTTAVVVDQGVFEAVISTESIDREGDIVVPEAMVKALHGWERPIPLAWNHSTKAEDIIGSLDGPSAWVEDGEVIAHGEVDLDTVRGREAWRLMKKRIVGFSFGYLTTNAVKRTDGGRTVTGLDIFEVSVTPTPMNNDTRVLSVKAADADGVRAKARSLMLEQLLAADPGPAAVKAAEPQRKSTEPITITSFEC